MALNQASILGNLGADPDIRTTKNGDKYARLSVATTDKWRDKRSGEMREKTEWHKVTVWSDGLVDRVIEPYVFKGTKVFIQGKLETNKWEDSNGVTHYTTEIVIGFGDIFELCGDKPPREEKREPKQSYSRTAGTNYDVDDDEIPF